MTRLDKAIVERGLARSRTEARTLIDAALVRVDGAQASKPSLDVGDGARIEVTGSLRPYVSRGGLKLAAALDEFAIDVTGRICLDVGASTGGFTDCLLQRGARHVTAVDVGHGQMDSKLAADPRVDLREGVNARSMTRSDFEVPFPIVVGDLSFISLTLVIPAISGVVEPGGDVVLLVKPQFEAGPAGIGKGGIVRDERRRQEAVERVMACAEAHGFTVAGSMTSPIEGGDGNVEYLLWLKESGMNG